MANSCSRCEMVPVATQYPARLFIWFPLRHTLSRVQGDARLAQLKHEVRKADDCLVITVHKHEDLTALAEAVSSEERRDARVLLMGGAAEPTFTDFPRVVSLAALLAEQTSGWLHDLLADSIRLVSYFQPIVEAADTSVIFAQEALLRGEDSAGKTIFPDRLFGTAGPAGLLFQLDRAARLAAIRDFTAAGLTSKVFINFSPASIYDPTFCLQSTRAAVQKAGLSPDRVVFEVVESEKITEVDHLLSILAEYRRAGYGVALDDVGAGYASLNVLTSLKPDYIKLDMELVRHVDTEPYKAVLVEKLLSLARELGIRSVAEGVETAEELAWLRAHGADLVQGYLVARPSRPPLQTTPKL